MQILFQYPHISEQYADGPEKDWNKRGHAGRLGAMTSKSNIHMHCTFCDGKNTMEEMVKDAISEGLESIGFSSHMHTAYRFDEVQMTDVELYFKTLERLQGEYAGKIRIYKGMELESLVNGEVRPEIDPRLDYTIGSSHLVRKDGRYFMVDYSAEEWIRGANYVGGPKKYIEIYLTDYCDFAKTVPFDIIGHIDLYTKFNEKCHFFNAQDKDYRELVLPYIDELCKTGKIFEVNTGAMSRGYTTAPYPSMLILRRLRENNARVIITSDSHKVGTICHHFEETEELLRSLGFTEQMKITDNGFVPVGL